MTFDEYQVAALRTYKSPLSGQHRLLNGALGLTGEAGEVADKIKKYIYPSKPGDGVGVYNDVVDELGDVLWYVAVLCNAIGVTMGDVAQGNVDKLAARHGVEVEPMT